MKMALRLLLVLTLLLVAACGSSKESNEQQEIDEVPTSKAPLIVQIASGDVNSNWDNMESDIGKLIKIKTGISLEFDFPQGESNTELFALMIANGEYPDLVMPMENVNQLVDAKVLLDLRPLIEEHAPNIMKVYGEYINRLVYSATDNSIYTLPINGVGQAQLEAGGSFQIQHQVLEELGYPYIKTVKDYEEAIKAYIEKSPTTEEGLPRLGLSLNGGVSHMLVSVTNPAIYATGAPYDGEFYVDQETYDVMLHYQRPEERAYFHWLNHMNDIGLLDKESFTHTYEQYKAKIASGRVIGTIDQDWNDDAAAQNVLKAEGKYGATYAKFPITLNENDKNALFQGTGLIAGNGVGITIDAADPVATIKFLDFLASDEGQVLVNWGIEGIHYNIEENGKRVIPVDIFDLKINEADSFQKQTGIGNYFLSARYGDGVLDPTGNYYTTNFPEQIAAAYSEADLKTLSAYNAATYKDLWPAESDFPERAYGAGWMIDFDPASEANVIFQKCQDLVKEYIPKIILAKPKQFDIIYDEFLAELEKIGVETMNAEFSQLIKDHVNMWSN